MSVSFEKINEKLFLATWKVDMLLKDLETSYFDSNAISETIDSKQEKRRKEYFASRILIHHLCEFIGIDFDGIRKDEFGKPHLINSSAHLSISHCLPYVVVLIDLEKPCGIDIEIPREQLNKVSHKFISEQEVRLCRNSLIKKCLLWSSKECLYKLYGRKKLDFKSNLKVEKIGKDYINSTIKTDLMTKEIKLQHRKLNKHQIVFSQ